MTEINVIIFQFDAAYLFPHHMDVWVSQTPHVCVELRKEENNQTERESIAARQRK